jgi:hypothetical protein
VVVRGTGEAGQGPMQLATLWGAPSRCIAIGDLGRQFGDFGVPSCDELDGDGSEVCHRSKNSAKLVSFGIRGPVK